MRSLLTAIVCVGATASALSQTIGNTETFSIMNGTFISGNAKSLMESDGEMLGIKADASGKVSFEFDTSAPAGDIESITLILCATPMTSMRQRVELYDFCFHRWMPVPTSVTGTRDGFTFTGKQMNCMIDPDTKRIRGRVTWTGLRAAWVDQLSWQFKQ
jgi:hypothetical protein